MEAPTLRLACALGGGGTIARVAEALKHEEAMKEQDAPTVRLVANARSRDAADSRGVAAFGPQESSVESPTVRLAHVPGAQGDNSLKGERGVPQLPHESRPALLVSYVYVKSFLEHRAKYAYRDWVLDSGAFTAHQQGTPIVIEEYIEKCRELLAEDKTLTEVYALDVIHDWQGTAKNVDKMWSAGIPAVPAFHFGSPEHELIRLAKNFPKIALGGAVGQPEKSKIAWAGQCFARVWPKKVHGFGFGGRAGVLALPWHSCDATNWELGPCKFGQWRSFGKMSVRGSKQNLRAEVEWYLALEREARQKWRREMALLESKDPAPPERLPLEAK